MELQASLLVYDIPESLDYPNPSPILRRLGFRVNLSCWCLPSDLIPWNTVNGWSMVGIKWRMIPFAHDAGENIIGMATAALKAEVEQAVNAAKKSEERAAAERDPVKRTRYWIRVRASLSRARRLLRDARQCAQGFKLAEDSLAVRSGLATIQALHIHAQQRAAQYQSMTLALGTVQGAAGLAASAQTSELPALVGADVLEEAGMDTSALRSAFSS